MDIRLLREDDRPLAAKLWKEAFDDSDKFIGWYLENKSKSAIGIFNAGALLSVLHLVPYKVMVQGKQMQTYFITGAATSKERRGQGLMRQLLYEALQHMRSEGVFLTYLYPFKHSFYEKYGWSTFSYVSRQTITKVRCKSDADVIETKDVSLLSSLYNRMMRSYQGYVIRSKKEWQWRTEELAVDNGRAAVLLKGGRARAYVLFYENKGKADIIETVYEDEEDIGAMLAYVLGQGFSSAEYFVPHSGDEKFGMARIVNAQALLNAIGAQNMLTKASITDDFAEWNNIGTDDKNQIDTAKLVAYVHSGTDLKTAEKLGHHFRQARTCIFETY